MMIIKCIRAVIVFTLVFLLFSPLWAQERKLSFSVLGGMNYVLEYGSESEYELGENDFPVTPAHMPLCFGVSVGYSLFKGLGLEADFRCHLSSSITLEDPSDGDEITFDTSKHYSLIGNIIYRFFIGSFQPYVLAGAGIDTLTGVEEQTLTSELGYMITLVPPEKKTDFVINVGGGGVLMFTPILGLRVDARYVYIPKSDDVPAVNSINVCGGLLLSF